MRFLEGDWAAAADFGCLAGEVATAAAAQVSLSESEKSLSFAAALEGLFSSRRAYSFSRGPLRTFKSMLFLKFSMSSIREMPQSLSIEVFLVIQWPSLGALRKLTSYEFLPRQYVSSENSDADL